MDTETTRRAFMAAIPAVAAGAAIPAASLAAQTDRSRWEYVMARFRAAERASDDYDAHRFEPAFGRERDFEEAHGIDWKQPTYFEKRDALRREHGTAYVVPDAMHDEHERLIEIAEEARTEVMATPAPDLAALRWKLDYFLDADADQGTSTSSWSADFIGQTIADIARLLPQGR